MYSPRISLHHWLTAKTHKPLASQTLEKNGMVTHDLLRDAYADGVRTSSNPQHQAELDEIGRNWSHEDQSELETQRQRSLDQ